MAKGRWQKVEKKDVEEALNEVLQKFYNKARAWAGRDDLGQEPEPPLYPYQYLSDHHIMVAEVLAGLLVKTQALAAFELREDLMKEQIKRLYNRLTDLEESKK